MEANSKSRPDTTLSVSRETHTKMAKRRPRGMTWDAFLTKELRLENPMDETIRRFAIQAEANGLAPAEEVEEAVREKIEALEARQ